MARSKPITGQLDATLPPATTPRIVSFPTEAEMKAAFEAYALAVGKVAYAWNFLHERLARLFIIASGAERHIALAIWYSTDSDRTQQGMLRAAIEAGGDRWPERPKAKDDLLWLINEANALADQRNNAVHTPASLYAGAPTSGDPAEMGSAFMQGHPRARRLMGKRLIEEFEWCERWAETLSFYAEKCQSSLIFAQYPWPDKPQRPTRGQKSTHPNPPPRRSRTKSRSRPPRSSQG
jgi:hypothetical protein